MRGFFANCAYLDARAALLEQTSRCALVGSSARGRLVRYVSPPPLNPNFSPH